MAWVCMNLKFCSSQGLYHGLPPAVTSTFTYLPGQKDSVLCGFHVNPPSSRFLCIFAECTNNCRLFMEDLIEHRFICPFRVPSPASLLSDPIPPWSEQHIPSIVPSLAICPAPRLFLDLTLPLSFSQGIFFQRNTIPSLENFCWNNVFFTSLQKHNHINK